ncbi:hypothetical protein, partial [Lacticaseibacillus paracasei]|uniref:hypothetical protein n=1 Tax=Lacticaseibacillus paracasei TaxID=1597 RepID=UPI0009CC2ED4
FLQQKSLQLPITEGLHEGSKCDCKGGLPCTISIADEFIKYVKLWYRICTGLKKQQKSRQFAGQLISLFYLC